MKHISLFSGIGGIDIAAEWAGFKTVCFVEIDPYCQKVLRKHWPDVPVVGDVRDIYRFAVEYKSCPDCGEPYCIRHREHFADCDCIGCSQWDDEYGDVDLISGGFPCQDISVAGSRIKQRGIDGERSGLWKEMHRIIRCLRPRYALIENVPALSTRGLNTILQDLAEIGYDAEWGIISTSQVGGKHKRERLFIIAYTQGIGIQGVWPQGVKIPQSLASTLLPLSHSDGQWEIEPDVRRVAHGIPSRVDRLKALGNAVVPQQIYPILKAIADIEMNLGEVKDG